MERERNSLSEEGRSSPGDPESGRSRKTHRRGTQEISTLPREMSETVPTRRRRSPNPIQIPEGPRPPQTRAASFKSLYRKRTGAAHQTTPDARLVPVHFRYSARTSRSFGFHRRACGSVKWILSGCAVGRSGERQFPETEFVWSTAEGRCRDWDTNKLLGHRSGLCRLRWLIPHQGSATRNEIR